MIIQTRMSGSTKALYRSGSSAPAVRTPATPPLPSRYVSPSRTNGNGAGTSNGSPKPSNGRKTRKKTGVSALWSPWKLILLSVALGLAGSVYLTHVFDTQNTLREVQQLRREYERAHRVHTEVQRNYDRMTGPAEVYNRAASLGMVSGGANDPVIFIER
jgi:hypothetical protein